MNKWATIKKIALLFATFTFYYSGEAQRENKSAQPLAIYLTFDDGPVKASSYIMDIVRRDSIAVNVFVVGHKAVATSEARELVNKYRSNSLVEIGNHSFSHAGLKYKKFYSRPGTVISDILLNNDTLLLPYKTVRLPGRNVWRVNGRAKNDLQDANAAADSLAKLGYSIYGWDIEWRFDSLQQSFFSAVQMINAVKYLVQHNLSFTSGHIVILLHDPMLSDEYFRKQLALFIQAIKEIPLWKFCNLNDYPGNGLLITMNTCPFIRNINPH